MSRRYAEVIGDPIAHSKSPLIHNFWLAKLGIDAEYRVTHVRTEELADYFARRRGDADWCGCNVTIPHKQRVGSHCDKRSNAADLIGAINCVDRVGSKLVGENTDGIGFREPLTSLLNAQPPNIVALVIGTGGAARAVCWELSKVTCNIVSLARNKEKASDLRTHLSLHDPDYPLMALGDLAHPFAQLAEGPAEQLNLLVNATPLGMSGYPALPVDLAEAPENLILYDLVYAPLETPLLAQAKARGMRTIDGLHMLVGQAAAAFELFFGQSAPREHDAELRALLTA